MHSLPSSLLSLMHSLPSSLLSFTSSVSSLFSLFHAFTFLPVFYPPHNQFPSFFYPSYIHFLFLLSSEFPVSFLSSNLLHSPTFLSSTLHVISFLPVFYPSCIHLLPVFYPSRIQFPACLLSSGLFVPPCLLNFACSGSFLSSISFSHKVS